MAKFDAALTHLFDFDRPAWLRLFGAPADATVTEMKPVLTSFTATADRVLRVEGNEPHLLHIEKQTRREQRLPMRLLRYNTLLSYRHKVPVRSVAFLLRRSADHADLTGELRLHLPSRPAYHVFQYEVIRLWRLPPDAFLQGGLGTLPLAPLTNINSGELEPIVRRVVERIEAEAPAAEVTDLTAAVYVLLGLEHSPAVVDRLVQGGNVMRDSATYRAVLSAERSQGKAEGKAEGIRELIIRIGEQRFGPPDPTVLATLNAITDPDQLRVIADRLLAASSWSTLMRPSDRK